MTPTKRAVEEHETSSSSSKRIKGEDSSSLSSTLSSPLSSTSWSSTSSIMTDVVQVEEPAPTPSSSSSSIMMDVVQVEEPAPTPSSSSPSSSSPSSSSSSMMTDTAQVPQYVEELKSQSKALKEKLQDMRDLCQVTKVLERGGQCGFKVTPSLWKIPRQLKDDVLRVMSDLDESVQKTPCLAVYGPAGVGKSFFVNSLLKVELTSSKLTEKTQGETQIPVKYRKGQTVKVFCTRSKTVLEELPEELHVVERHQELADRLFKTNTTVVDVTPENKTAGEIQALIKSFNQDPNVISLTVSHPEISVDFEIYDYPGDLDTSSGKALRNARMEHALTAADVVLIFQSQRSADFEWVMERLHKRFWLNCRNVLPTVGIVVNGRGCALAVENGQDGLTRLSKNTEEEVISTFQRDAANAYGLKFDEDGRLSYLEDSAAKQQLPVAELDAFRMLIQGAKMIFLADRDLKRKNVDLQTQLTPLIMDAKVRRENFFTRRASKELKRLGDKAVSDLEKKKPNRKSKKSMNKTEYRNFQNACQQLSEVLTPGYAFSTSSTRRNSGSRQASSSQEFQLALNKVRSSTMAFSATLDSADPAETETKKHLESLVADLVDSLKGFHKALVGWDTYNFNAVQQSSELLSECLDNFKETQIKYIQQSQTGEQLRQLSQNVHPFRTPKEYLETLCFIDFREAVRKAVNDLREVLKETVWRYDTRDTERNKATFQDPRLLVKRRTLTFPVTESENLDEAYNKRVEDESIKRRVCTKRKPSDDNLEKCAKDFSNLIDERPAKPATLNVSYLGDLVTKRLVVEFDRDRQKLQVSGSRFTSGSWQMSATCLAEIKEKATNVHKAATKFGRKDKDSQPALFPIVIWSPQEGAKAKTKNIASFVAFVASRKQVEENDYDIPLLILLVHQVPTSAENKRFAKKSLQHQIEVLQEHFEDTLSMGSDAGVRDWAQRVLQNCIVEVAIRCAPREKLGDGRILSTSQHLCEQLLEAPYYHLLCRGSRFRQFDAESRSFTEFSIYTAARALAFNERVMLVSNRSNSEEEINRRKCALENFKTIANDLDPKGEWNLRKSSLSKLLEHFTSTAEITKTAKQEDELRAALNKIVMPRLSPSDFHKAVERAILENAKPNEWVKQENLDFLSNLKETLKGWNYVKECKSRPDIHPLAHLLGLFLDKPRCAQVATDRQRVFRSSENYAQEQEWNGMEAYLATENNPTHRVSLDRSLAMLMNTQATRGISFVSKETLFDKPRAPYENRLVVEKRYTRQLLLHGYGGCATFSFIVRNDTGLKSQHNTRAKSRKEEEDSTDESSQDEEISESDEESEDVVANSDDDEPAYDTANDSE